ncbi:hypothetical protein M91_14977 [Bos mutus]|uniref:Formiminotransferase N-terminal subdomain domain-containing protein n=1 Tax=Bos mutus TaxID=72004 RepID=L8IK44_9CETA|nr:hypothetical protein M91_14977 [Bos mutus]
MLLLRLQCTREVILLVSVRAGIHLHVPKTLNNNNTKVPTSAQSMTTPLDWLSQGNSVLAACLEAFQSIDMEVQEGIHPCLGAVDLIPIYPPSGVGVEECGAVARRTGFKTPPLQHHGLCTLIQYSRAVTPNGGSGLSRSEAGPSQETGIGASPYVMNCNVTIDSQDLALGKEIASAIRGSNVNGLKGVQTMAFPHEGKIEIACNVESFEDQEVTETSEGSQYMAYSVLGDHFYYISPHYIEAQVKKLASD